MDDRESEIEEPLGNVLANLRHERVSSPSGLRERVSARVRLELLRRDLLDFFTGAPTRMVRQLLRRERSRPGPDGEDPSRGTRM